jgi:hypothetical protein
VNGKGKGKTAGGTEGDVIYRETRKLKFADGCRADSGGQGLEKDAKTNRIERDLQRERK